MSKRGAGALRTGRVVSGRCAVVLALLACLVIAGCAQRDRGAEDANRSGGFYGGVSGGLTHP